MPAKHDPPAATEPEPEGSDDFDEGTAPEDPPLSSPVTDDEGSVLANPDFGDPALLPDEPDTAGTPLDDLLRSSDEEVAWSVPAVDDAVVLPWKVDVRLPPSPRTLPAILDPTRDASVWVRPDPAPEAEPRKVDLGPICIEVLLRPEVGPEERLVLGRDALRGRILVRSG